MQHRLSFTFRCSAATVVLFFLSHSPFSKAAEPLTIQRLEPRPASGLSLAVRVQDAQLVHTSQLAPSPAVIEDCSQQTQEVLAQLDRLLDEFKSGRDDVVKLNVYVRNAAVREAFAEALAAWAPAALPAVAYVATPLPNPRHAVALDAVFAARRADPDDRVTHHHVAGLHGDNSAVDATVLPRGDVVYLAGQAEAGSLGEATAATLGGLERTLQLLELQTEHIVQLKCFLDPIRDADTVRQECVKFFGEGRVPPVVYVQWISAARPIEIELIAWAPGADVSDSVSYANVPWIKPSAVYSRSARIHGDDRIYISGLYAASAGDGASQVRSVFENLKQVLAASGSDLLHLAKATYYVSDDDASRQLNELRPSYYDPQRPPAASKAAVQDVAAPGRSMTMDIIAAPVVTAHGQ